MLASSQLRLRAADCQLLFGRELTMSGCKVAYWLVFAAAIGLSKPAAAQTAPVEPEALVDASLAPDTGLALARQQITDADLLGAVGTLERVLLVRPDAAAPRLVYASLLCRLDDRAGAQIEIDLMNGRAAPDEAWSEVRAACGPTNPSPASTGGTR